MARVGDRWLIGVREVDHPVEPSDSLVPGHPAVLASKVISVDACGEDRRELAQDVNQIRAPLGEDEPWLGCSDARSRVVWFDPAGTEAAIPVPGVTACPERLAGNSLIDVTDGVLTGRSDLV